MYSSSKQIWISSQYTLHTSQGNSTDWKFGRQLPSGWPLPYQPYHFPLAGHSGVIMGLTEKGITMSLLQLASLAIKNGWRVVLFDAQTSEEKQAQFMRVMQQAGCTTLPPSTGTITLRSQLERGVWSPTQREPSLFPFTLRYYLDTLFANTNEATGYQEARAAYIGVNVWNHPIEASTHASFLLTHIVKTISEQASGTCPTLLLIKHPELLFGLDQIPPLFALMDQAQGSVFIATRSSADFGCDEASIIKNAQTMIVHKSSPTWGVTESIAEAGQSFFNATVRVLPDDECFVIHRGQATHVKLINPDPPPTERYHAEKIVPLNDDDENFFTYLFGSGKE